MEKLSHELFPVGGLKPGRQKHRCHGIIRQQKDALPVQLQVPNLACADGLFKQQRGTANSCRSLTANKSLVLFYEASVSCAKVFACETNTECGLSHLQRGRVGSWLCAVMYTETSRFFVGTEENQTRRCASSVEMRAMLITLT
jgi:uridine phosphorylase